MKNVGVKKLSSFIWMLVVKKENGKWKRALKDPGPDNGAAQVSFRHPDGRWAITRSDARRASPGGVGGRGPPKNFFW